MSWADLAGGVIAGLAATGAWVLATRFYEFVRLRKKFGRYVGRYSITRKQQIQTEPYEAVVTVKRNVLSICLRNLPVGDSGGGTILMNEQLRGEGHYWRH
jgi:hypothetical protein